MKRHTNSSCDNLTKMTSLMNVTIPVMPNGCTNCHFTHQPFIDHVNNRPTNQSYFCGKEIANTMQQFAIPNVKVRTTTPSFNIKEDDIICAGHKCVGGFMFDQVLKLCIQNMNRKKYGESFGSMIKFHLVFHDSNKHVIFTPFLIRWIRCNQNSRCSDQLSKSKSSKILKHQKNNHMVGINIKSNTVTVFDSATTTDVKLGFCFDNTLVDGHVVWQYRCIDKLQHKKCYLEACKDSPRKKRQLGKQLKRNHIIMLQNEQKHSAYLPVLFLRKDEHFSKTISKIHHKIYMKKQTNSLFDLFVTIE